MTMLGGRVAPTVMSDVTIVQVSRTEFIVGLRLCGERIFV
jgi:hypothetical protein